MELRLKLLSDMEEKLKDDGEHISPTYRASQDAGQLGHNTGVYCCQ